MNRLYLKTYSLYPVRYAPRAGPVSLCLYGEETSKTA